jgi:acyl-coenzyme A synthetase/AMP-(fatty) acid ligase
MLQVPDVEKEYDLSSIRLAASAGEALPGTVWKEWKEKLGVEILDGIGSTEILHIYISNRAGESRPDCTGKIVPGYEAKIVDEDGNPVPTGGPGTLMVKGESIAAFYWNKHEKTNIPSRASGLIPATPITRTQKGTSFMPAAATI